MSSPKRDNTSDQPLQSVEGPSPQKDEQKQTAQIGLQVPLKPAGSTENKGAGGPDVVTVKFDHLHVKTNFDAELDEMDKRRERLDKLQGEMSELTSLMHSAFDQSNKGPRVKQHHPKSVWRPVERKSVSGSSASSPATSVETTPPKPEKEKKAPVREKRERKKKEEKIPVGSNMCRNFLQGKCTRKNCKYSHDIEDITVAEPPSPEGPDSEDNPDSQRAMVKSTIGSYCPSQYYPPEAPEEKDDEDFWANREREMAGQARIQEIVDIKEIDENFKELVTAQAQFITVNVDVPLSRRVVAWAAKEMPNFNFVGNSAKYSSHPRLRIERAALEAYCVRMFSGRRIDDIGSNQVRMSQYSNVWCICPEMQAKDVLRNKQAADLKLRNYCKCEASSHYISCTHKTTEPAGQLYIHSLYYFRPQVVAENLTKCSEHTAFAVVHKFDNALGHLANDEIMYQRYGPDVACKVRGYNVAYLHDACDWVSNPWGIIKVDVDLDGVSQMLMYTTVFQTSSSRVVRLSLHPETDALLGAIPPDFYTLDANFMDEMTGTIHMSFADPLNKHNELVKLLSSKKIMTELYSHGQSMSVKASADDSCWGPSFPKTLVSALMVKISCRPRDQDSYAYLVRECTALLSAYAIPGNSAAMILGDAVNVAFFLRIRNERDALESHLDAVSRVIESHTALHRQFSTRSAYARVVDFLVDHAETIAVIGLGALYFEHRRRKEKSAVSAGSLHLLSSSLTGDLTKEDVCALGAFEEVVHTYLRIRDGTQWPLRLAQIGVEWAFARLREESYWTTALMHMGCGALQEWGGGVGSVLAISLHAGYNHHVWKNPDPFPGLEQSISSLCNFEDENGGTVLDFPLTGQTHSVGSAFVAVGASLLCLVPLVLKRMYNKPTDAVLKFFHKAKNWVWFRCVVPMQRFLYGSAKQPKLTFESLESMKESKVTPYSFILTKRSLADPKDVQVPTHLSGIGFSNLVPVSYSNSINNAKRAIASRFLKDNGTLRPEDLLVTPQQAFILRLNKLMHDDIYPVGPQRFANGMPFARMDTESWARRFPAARRDMYLKTMREHSIDRATVERSLYVKTFLKRELHLHANYSTIKESAPRLIQPVDPVIQLYLGPYYASELRWKAKVTWRPNSVARFAITHSAEEVGQALCDMVEEVQVATDEEVVIVEGDFSKFDGSQTTHVAQNRLNNMEIMRYPPEVIDVQALSYNCTLSTVHGIKYGEADSKIPLIVTKSDDPVEVVKCPRMLSGHPATTVANTDTNVQYHCATALVAFCKTKKIHDEKTIIQFVDDLDLCALPYRIMAGGDDGISVTTKTIASSQEWQKFGSEYKLPLDLKVFHLSMSHRAEFFSQRFWPTSEGKLVLGVKPGRLFRVSYSTEYFRTWKARLLGAVLSLENSSMHVPFARVFVEQVKRLCSNVAPIYPPDLEHKILATKIHHASSNPIVMGKHTWPSTWDMFYDIYGLTPEDERIFRLSSPISPLWTHLFGFLILVSHELSRSTALKLSGVFSALVMKSTRWKTDDFPLNQKPYSEAKLQLETLTVGRLTKAIFTTFIFIVLFVVNTEMSEKKKKTPKVVRDAIAASQAISGIIKGDSKGRKLPIATGGPSRTSTRPRIDRPNRSGLYNPFPGQGQIPVPGPGTDKHPHDPPKRDPYEKPIADQIAEQVDRMVHPEKYRDPPRATNPVIAPLMPSVGFTDPLGNDGMTESNGRAESKRSYENRLNGNVLNYLASVDNPILPGGRIPDDQSLPSLTTQLRWFTTLTPVTGATSGYAVGFVVYPTMKSTIGVLTSLTTNDSGAAYTYSDPPDYTGIASAMSAYRVVSVGVKVMDAGAMTTRGLSCICGNLDLNHFSAQQATPITMVREARTVEVMDSATCANDCHLHWVPKGNAETTVFTATPSIVVKGTSWRPVSTVNTNLDDNVIYFHAYSNASTTDVLQIQIIMNIEMIPNYSNPWVGVPMVVDGDSSRLLELQERSQTKPISMESGLSMGWIGNAADAISKGLGFKGFKDAAGQVLRKAVDWITPFAAGLFGDNQKKHLMQCHTVAMALGLDHLSPFDCPSGQWAHTMLRCKDHLKAYERKDGSYDVKEFLLRCVSELEDESSSIKDTVLVSIPPGIKDLKSLKVASLLSKLAK